MDTSTHPTGAPQRLVVVGGGMVAHRLVEALQRPRRRPAAWEVDVFAEEPRPPYDRVALTSFFSGRDPDDLLLGDPDLWRRRRRHPAHATRRSPRSTPSAATVHAPRPASFGYDALVLATGSSAFVPPVTGSDLPGCFVYRTVDDVAELRAWVDDPQPRAAACAAPSSAAACSAWRRPAR